MENLEKCCEHCNKIFKTKSQIRKYCSQKCFRLWRKEYWHPSKEHKQAISDKLKGQKTTGKPFEKDHTINNGREPWNKNKKGLQVAWNKEMVMKNYYDEEQYKKFIEGCIKGGVSCCLKVASNKNRTEIELIVKEILDEIGVRYMEQYPLLGITVSDFYLQDNHLVIYCDGNYWHNYPHGTKKDYEVNKELTNNHYKVLRFWEIDIKDKREDVKEKIIRELQRL